MAVGGATYIDPDTSIYEHLVDVLVVTFCKLILIDDSLSGGSSLVRLDSARAGASGSSKCGALLSCLFFFAHFFFGCGSMIQICRNFAMGVWT